MEIDLDSLFNYYCDSALHLGVILSYSGACDLHPPSALTGWQIDFSKPRFPHGGDNTSLEEQTQGHHEYCQTSCPGLGTEQVLDEIIIPHKSGQLLPSA